MKIKMAVSEWANYNKFENITPLQKNMIEKIDNSIIKNTIQVMNYENK